ncbi:hypothetical protein CTP10_R66110 (plasmid) [Cupriavidus sp. P-10]|nr:hypothetical protein CTP10_R66110 [Cupriavidus sp. P-10]
MALKKWLEPDAGRPARPVLRGRRRSNASLLPDQVHYVDQETGEIVNKPIKRAKFLEYFTNRTPCLIGMEACGGAHHWARQLMKMGHEVRLMPAEFVKAFNIGNKTDAADARAIWLAVQQPGKPVAVKTEMQQAMLGLHRMREQLVKFRTMQINGLRGLLTEYGEVMSKGRTALDKGIPEVLCRLAQRLPGALVDTLREQWNGLAELDKQVAEIERRMREWKKEDEAVKAISEIPGVGLLTATAAVAMWAIRKHSARVGNSRRGQAWCPSRPARAARWIYTASAREVIHTSARY